MVNGLHNNYKITTKKNVLFLFSIVFLCAITLFAGVGLMVSANKAEIAANEIVVNASNETEDDTNYEEYTNGQYSEEIIDPENKNFPAFDLITIYFDENGGVNVDNITTAAELVTQGTFPFTARNGYYLMGWYVSEVNNNGSGTKAGDPGDFFPQLLGDEHYYARWASRIVFDSNGGSACVTQYVGFSSIISLPTPTKSGQGFLGWYTSESGDQGTGTKVGDGGDSFEGDWGNDTFYARWGYEVTYNTNGGNAISSVQVSGGSSVTLPLPLRDNYTFNYWRDTDAVIYDNGDSVTITESITFTAKWKATVTFDANGGDAVSSQVVVDGGTISTLPTTTKPKSTFIGWSTSESNDNGTEADLVSTYTVDSGHDTLYARYEVTISFDANGGSVVNSKVVDPGDVVTLSSSTRTGYSFAGWSTIESGGNGTAASLVDSGAYSTLLDITLHARWTATITLDENGGNDLSNVVAEPGESLTFEDAMWSGYSFIGWSTAETNNNGTEATLIGSYTVTGNDTIHARWETNIYFNPNNGDADFAITAEPNEIITLPTVTRTGFVFDSWCTAEDDNNGTAATSVSSYTVTGSDYLYARWNVTIAFDVNGGDAVSEMYASIDEVITLPDAIKTNYVFGDWSTAEINNNGTAATIVSTSYTVTGNITLYARWLCTITFDVNSGSAVSTMYQGLMENISLPASTRSGYVFGGWYDSETSDNGDGTFIGNNGDNWMVNISSKTLYARWLNTITFYTGANYTGSAVDDINEAAGETITLPTISTLGYDFVGWSTVKNIDNGTSANLVTISYTIPGNITLYARWTVTLSFDSNGGGAVGDIVVPYSENYSLGINSPTLSGKIGYSPVGWSTEEINDNGTLPTLTTIYTADQGHDALYARWDINSYNLTFYGNTETGGSTAVQSIVYNTLTPLNANGFYKTGYHFVGWSEFNVTVDEDLVLAGEIDYVDTADFTIGADHDELYAIWEIDLYTITLHQRDGSSWTDSVLGGTVRYGRTIAYEGLTLSKPTLSQNTFIEWTTINWVTETPSVNSTFTEDTVITDNIDIYTAFWEGKGTQVSYIEIATIVDFTLFKEYVNNQNPYSTANWSDDKYFSQTADLDFTSSPEIGSVGITGSEFKGVYYGNNHKITDYSITGGSNNSGLFGSISEATIQDIFLEDFTVSASGDHTGGLAGYSYKSIIENIGVLSGGSITGASFTGGLIGMATDTDVLQCFNKTASVSGAGATGGLIGSANLGSTITRSFNSGNVTASSNGDIAGLTGTLNSATVTQSYVIATLSSNYPTGYIGGIVADMFNSTVSESYAVTTINAASTAENYKGGIVGSESGIIELNRCYWNSNVTNAIANTASNTGATEKTTTLLKNASTYLAWDFNSDWYMYGSVNNGYPVLRINDTLSVNVTNGTSVYGTSIEVGYNSTTNLVFEPATGFKLNEIEGQVSPDILDSAQIKNIIINGYDYVYTGIAKMLGEGIYYSQIGDTLTVTFTSFAGGWQAVADLSTAKGDGTGVAPYIITTPEELAGLDGVLGDAWLGANIDLSGKVWEPITFTGLFNGNGYAIHNMYVNTTDAGLFSTINGTVKNLTINSSAVYGTNSGMIAYNLNGDITDTYVEGLVFGSSAGGLAYQVADGSSIERTFNDARVIGDLSAGGFVANAQSLTINNVYNKGQIECLNGTTLGGLIGTVQDVVTISNAYNIGVIKGNSGSAFVGVSNAPTTITDSYYLEGMSDLTGAISEINSSFSVNGGADNYAAERTDSAMKLQATYTGFGFDSTPLTYAVATPWVMDDLNINNGYPTLIGVATVAIIGNSPAYGTNEVSAGKYEIGQINSFAITVTPDSGYAIGAIVVNGLNIKIEDMTFVANNGVLLTVGLAGAVQTVDVTFVEAKTITFYKTNDGVTWVEYDSVVVPVNQKLSLNTAGSVMVANPTVIDLGAGYTFIKWVTTEGGETEFSEESIITTDVSIYGWIEASVTFDLNGGNITGDTNPVVENVRLNKNFDYTHDAGVYATEPIKVGYDFSEWNETPAGDGNSFNNATIVDGVKVLTAIWNPKTNITYSFEDYIDGVSATGVLTYKASQDYSVTYALTVDNSVELSAPQVWGYDFDSWSLKPGETFGVLAGDTYTIAPEDENGFIIIANYTAKTNISVTFTSDIPSINVSEYNSYMGDNTIDEEIVLTTPIVTGYIFDGWEIVTGVNINYNDNISLDSRFYFYPEDEAGVTLKANFTPKVVTVTLTHTPSNTLNPVSNWTDADTDGDAEVDELITLNAGTMQGYELDYWEVIRAGDNDILAGNTYTILPSDETGVTIKANYKVKTGISVTFTTKPAVLTNNGSDDWEMSAGVNTVNQEITFSHPDNADIVGYNFDHWEIERVGDNTVLAGSTYIILPEDEDGVNVLAVYTPKIVTVNFETNIPGLTFRNSAVLSYTGVNEVAATITLTAPSNANTIGYAFDSWSLKPGEALGSLVGSDYTFVPEDEVGITVVANYVAKTGISVTFTTAPVSDLAVPTFTNANDVNSLIILNTPAAVDGYEFNHWNIITGTNAMEVDGISYLIAPEDDLGIEFEAVYEPKDVTVTFEYVPAGKNVTAPAYVTGLQVTGEEMTLNPALIEGYTFDYWEIERAGANDVLVGNTYTPLESDDGSITAIGYYTANEVTVVFVSNPVAAGTNLEISGGVTPLVDSTITFVQTNNDVTKYQFSHWSSPDANGALTGLNGNTYTIEAADFTNGGIAIVANYEVLVEFELTGESGTGNVDTANGFFLPDSSYSFTASAAGYNCIDWTVEIWDGFAWVDTGSDVAGNPIIATIPAAPTKYIANMEKRGINVQVSPENLIHGSTSGTGAYGIDDSLNVTATSYAGYKFDYWEVYNDTTLLTALDLAGTGLDTFISAGATVNYTLTGADIDEIYDNFTDSKLILKAVFDYQEITIDIQADTGGNVTDIDGTYILTDTLNLTATADNVNGYVFDAWTFEDKDGATLSSSYLALVNEAATTYNFTEANIGNIQSLRDGTLIIKATFIKEQVLVNFTSYPVAAASMMSYIGSSYVGSTITLTQTANINYEFDYWEVIAGVNSISGAGSDEYVVHTDDYNITSEIGVVAHYKVNVISINDGGGSLDLIDGYRTPSDVVVVTSTANAGKYLLNIEIQTWNGTSWVPASTTTDNPYSLTVPTVPIRLVANYSDKEYNVSTTVNIEDGEVLARGVATGSTGIVDGTEITITATANDGYEFSHWAGLDVLENYGLINVNNYEITYTITATDIETIELLPAQTLEAVAYFIKKQVVIDCIANTGGTVDALAVSVYEVGDTFNLTANPDDTLGYVFDRWYLKDGALDVGDLTGTNLASFDVFSNPASHTLNAADIEFISALGTGTLTFRAGFVKQNVTINFEDNAPNASSVGSWSSVGSTSYVGDTISLSQTFDPTYGYEFNRWEVTEGESAITGATSDEYLITHADFLRGYVTVKAVYNAWIEFGTMYDAGVGTIDLPDGYHEIGTTATATASANGYSFNKWEEYTFDGADWVYVKESSLNPYDITVDNVKSRYVALFMPQTVYISVVSSDLSKGTVTGSASLTSDDSSMTISATAFAGYTLTSWSGLDILEGLGSSFTATDTSIVYSLTLTDINTITNDVSIINDTLILTANFDSLDVSINVVSSDVGLGTVTPVTGDYNVGDSISLISAGNDAAGYEFDYWQVEGLVLDNIFVDAGITTYPNLTENDIQNIYDLNASHELTITAHFRLKIYTVYSNIVRGVGGTLVASDAEEKVTHGGSITYTLTPSTGYWITGLVVNSVSVIDDADCSVQKFAKTGTPQIYTLTNVISEPSIEVTYTKYHAVSFYTVVSNAEVYTDTGTAYEVSDGSTLNNMLLDTKYQDLFGISEMPTVTNAGGTFDGWSDNTVDNNANFTNKTQVDYDLDIYAVFKSTITFSGNGANEVPAALTDYRIGNPIALPVLTKDGYSFDYWLRADGLTHVGILDTAINKGNEMLSANWLENFTLTYFYPAKTATWTAGIPSRWVEYTTVTVTSGHSITTDLDANSPANPINNSEYLSEDGYTFNLWYSELNVTAFTANTVVTEDMNIYAGILATVEFDLYGGTSGEADDRYVMLGAKIGTLPVASKPSATLRWYRNELSEQVDENYEITYPQVISAVWLGDETTLTVKAVTNGKVFTESNPHNGNGGNVKINAGIVGTVSSETVNLFQTLGTSGTEIVISASINEANYEFLGWYYDINFERIIDFDGLTLEDADTTLYARFEGVEKVLTVTSVTNNEISGLAGDIQINGGVSSNMAFQPVRYGENAVLSVVNINSSYNFMGWFTEVDGGVQLGLNTDIVFSINMGESQTIYARFIGVDCDVAIEIYPSLAGTAVGAGTFAYGTDVTLSWESTFEGYEFYGWVQVIGSSEQAGLVQAPDYTITPIMGDITYRAKFKLEMSFGITGEGSIVSTYAGKSTTITVENEASVFTVLYLPDASLTLTPVADTGYSFTSWNIDPNEDGLAGDSNGVIIGNVPIKPTTFSAAFDLSSFNTTANMVVSDLAQGQTDADAGSVYVSTTEIEGTHDVTSTISEKYGFTATLNANVFTGYEFKGWYTNYSCTILYSEDLTADITITEDEQRNTYYAKFEPMTYTLAYDENFGEDLGNTELEDVTDVYGAEIFSLPIPARMGYNFLGWYDSEELVVISGTLLQNNGSGNLIADDAGVLIDGAVFIDRDIIYYAKWESKETEILLSFHENSPNNGYLSVVGTEIKGEVGDEIVIEIIVDEGYEFVTWSEDVSNISLSGEYNRTVRATYFVNPMDADNAQTTIYATIREKEVDVYITNTFGGDVKGSSSSTYYKVGDELTLTCNPASAYGYYFTGWTQEGLKADNWTAAGISGDVTATYTLTALDIEEGYANGRIVIKANFAMQMFNVTFIYAGGIEEGNEHATQKVLTGEDAVRFGTYGKELTPPVLSKTAYEFKGWTLMDTTNANYDYKEPIYNIRIYEDITFIANWQVQTYTIEVEIVGFGIVKIIKDSDDGLGSIVHNDDITCYVIADENYTTSGIYLDDEFLTAEEFEKALEEGIFIEQITEDHEIQVMFSRDLTEIISVAAILTVLVGLLIGVQSLVSSKRTGDVETQTALDATKGTLYNPKPKKENTKAVVLSRHSERVEQANRLGSIPKYKFKSINKKVKINKKANINKQKLNSLIQKEKANINKKDDPKK